MKGQLQCVDRFLLMPSSLSTAKYAQNGELFARIKLNSDISEDTAYGRLILQNVHNVYLAKYQPKDPDAEPDKVADVFLWSICYVTGKVCNQAFHKMTKICRYFMK